jgi:hypothetical protein
VADTNFVDFSTVVVADWLNDINDHVYSNTPISPASSVHPASSISVIPTGGIIATNVQAALAALDTAKGTLGNTIPLVNGVASAGVSGSASRIDHVHPVDTSRAAAIHTHVLTDITGLNAQLATYATINSPVFTGTPQAPTVVPSTDSTTKIATTAFVQSVITAGAFAPINSPVFTGTPTVPNVVPSTDNSTKAANTAFVQSVITAGAFAPINSPTFTGVPAGPTVASAADSTTKLATTAFVQAAITNAGGGGGLPGSNTVPIMDGIGAAGVANTAARGDHVHPSDTTKADLSAVVTITGTQTVTGAKTFSAALVASSTLNVTGATALTTLSATTGTFSSSISATSGTFTGALSTTSTLGVSGLSTLASLSVTNNATVGGTLGVTGATTLGTLSTTAASVAGALTVGTTLGVTGTSTLGVVNAASGSTTGAFGVGGVLTVTGNAVHSTASFSGAVTMATTLAVAGTSTLGATNTGVLGVTGNTTLTGDAVIVGNGRRIKGAFDIASGTLTSRLAFQSSLTNSLSVITVLPSGSGTGAYCQGYATSDPDNSPSYNLSVTPAGVILSAEKSGTGSFVPITFSAGGSDRQRFETDGRILAVSPAGLGYGAGAGGTVTQATDKSTTVTLNRPCGRITMNNASLASNAVAAFVCLNSMVGPDDVVVPSLGPNVGAVEQYSIGTRVLAGAIHFALQNISAGALAQAVEINFAVIKGSTT